MPELPLLARFAALPSEVTGLSSDGRWPPLVFPMGDLVSELAHRYRESGQVLFDGDAFELLFSIPPVKKLAVLQYRKDPKRVLFRLSRYLSPITGKPIVLNTEEFSPGNAYLRIVTEEELSNVVSDPRVPLGPDWIYIYFRVYGEESVIAEGITQMSIISGIQSAQIGTDPTLGGQISSRASRY